MIPGKSAERLRRSAMSSAKADSADYADFKFTVHRALPAPPLSGVHCSLLPQFPQSSELGMVSPELELGEENK